MFGWLNDSNRNLDIDNRAADIFANLQSLQQLAGVSAQPSLFGGADFGLSRLGAAASPSPAASPAASRAVAASPASAAAQASSKSSQQAAKKPRKPASSALSAEAKDYWASFSEPSLLFDETLVSHAFVDAGIDAQVRFRSPDLN